MGHHKKFVDDPKANPAAAAQAMKIGLGWALLASSPASLVV